MRQICDRIQDECSKSGLTLSHVLGSAKLGQSLFYKWRNGNCKPRPSSIKAIARALGIPAVTLAPEMAEQLLDTRDAHDAGSEGIADDVVFVGMKLSVFNALRPLLARSGSNVFEVPRDCSAGLMMLMQPGSLLQWADAPAA